MEWISVKDNLPLLKKNPDNLERYAGTSEDVLIWMSGYLIAKYHHALQKWAIPGYHGDWQPTHWQPLPEPPKG
jgi:hypothetical protein